MGMTRRDVAEHKPVCPVCHNVGRVPGMRQGRANVKDCQPCKGRGYLIPKLSRADGHV